MKCNEAFDMIFNGGEAVLPSREYSKDYRLHFNEDGVLCVPRVEHTKSAPVLHKADLKRDDWIVEKDGVVYEEKPKICCICKEKIGREAWESSISKDRIIYDTMHSRCRPANEQDQPTGLEDNGQKWGEIKMPIIADEVNEDWLEQKLACFMHRTPMWKDFAKAGFLMVSSKKCAIPGCQFCFPHAKPKGITIPADKVILYTCIHGTYPCEECYEKYKKENHSEQPREKVTVESLEKLINICVRGVSYWEEVNNPVEERRRSLSMACEAKEEIMKKLEYLVSLQETKCLLNK